VPVGGGGLVGGIAAWYAGAVRVVGVEPEAAPTLIRRAQQALWDRVRIVAEPGAAAAFAALLDGAYVPAPDERVGVVITGAITTAVDFR
jgi:threonine dehydratase